MSDSDSDEPNSRRAIEPRRVEGAPYLRRFSASRTRHDEAVVVNAGQIGRHVAQNIREELSISVSQFASEEEFELLERYSPGSASRLIDATIDRIEASTENRRENGKTKRAIDVRGQWLAFAAFVILVVAATLWVSWGHAAAGGFLATTLVIGVIVAFIASSKIELVARYIGKNGQSDPPSPANPA